MMIRWPSDGHADDPAQHCPYSGPIFHPLGIMVERRGPDHVVLLTFLADHGERGDVVDAVYQRIKDETDWLEAAKALTAVIKDHVVAAMQTRH